MCMGSWPLLQSTNYGIGHHGAPDRLFWNPPCGHLGQVKGGEAALSGQC